MSRRFALASVAAATLAAGTFTAPASSAPVTELPRMDCKQRIVDSATDAKFMGATAVDGAEITSVFLRMTAEELQVIAAFKDLKTPAQMPATDGAYKFTFSAKIGAKTLNLFTSQLNPAEPWGSVLKTPGNHSTPYAHTGSLKPEDQLPGWAFEFRPDKELLIFTVPRARLEQNVGKPFEPGDQLTSIAMQTHHMAYDNPTLVDQLPSTPALSWNVEDESCFGPPPSKLADLVVPTDAVQHTDAAQLTAKLTNEAGAAVAGKVVEFRVGDAAPVPATTGADGVATASFKVPLAAGEYPVVATFAGDATDGKSRVDGATLTVVTEPTAFGTLAVTKPTTKTRTVTATLLDNDKTPVAGQPVVWYVNGKKVATIVSDAKGKTVFKAAKPTQTVQAKFAGVTDKYAAANSKSVKV